MLCGSNAFIEGALLQLSGCCWKSEEDEQAAQAQGGLGSSCFITQDYKEMYGDCNDLGKSYDLIMKLEINVLYLQIVVSCVPSCVNTAGNFDH